MDVISRLFIIGCGAKKRPVASPASELYIGPLFTATLAYARSQTSDENIRILSAYHGFLPLEQVIEPYDVTWNKGGSISMFRLREQISPDWENREIVLLMGADYVVKVGYALQGRFGQPVRVERPLQSRGTGF